MKVNDTYFFEYSLPSSGGMRCRIIISEVEISHALSDISALPTIIQLAEDLDPNKPETLKKVRETFKVEVKISGQSVELTDDEFIFWASMFTDIVVEQNSQAKILVRTMGEFTENLFSRLQRSGKLES